MADPTARHVRAQLCRYRGLVPESPMRSAMSASARSSTRSARGSAMAAAVVIWTIAHVAHGGAYSVSQFALARFGLGIGESGNFPRGDQDGRHLVSREGARAGDRHLQRRHQCRRDPDAADRVPDGPGVRLADDLRADRRARAAVAGELAAGLSRRSRGASQGRRRRSRAHRLGPRRSRDPRRRAVDPPARAARDLAFALGKFFIDPIWWFYLFWLPGYLGDQYHLDLKNWTSPTAALALAAIYLISDAGSVAGGWLSRAADEIGDERQQGAQADDAGLRLLRAAGDVRDLGLEPVGQRADHRRCGGCAPGLLGEPVHRAFGHLPALRSGRGDRHRRDGRRDRRQRSSRSSPAISSTRTITPRCS